MLKLLAHFTLSYLTDGLFEYIDGGDVPLYAQIMMQDINEMANKPDPATQATAVMQSIATVGELANGSPGDACEAAAVCISLNKIRNQIIFQAIKNLK